MAQAAAEGIELILLSLIDFSLEIFDVEFLDKCGTLRYRGNSLRIFDCSLNWKSLLAVRPGQQCNKSSPPRPNPPTLPGLSAIRDSGVKGEPSTEIGIRSGNGRDAGIDFVYDGDS